MAATLSDIADTTGLSISTVSRVLNDKAAKYRISADTEEVVLKAARKLNYRPNHLARGLRLKQTNTLGLLAPDISNPFFAHIIKRIQKVAHDMGYSLIVCNTDESPELECEQVQLLYRKRVDGVIAMPVGLDSSHFAELIEKGVPIVMLDRCFDELEVNSVVVDNYRGSYDAVTHLVQMGHSRIGFVQGLPGTYTNTERLRGYRDALTDGEIEVDESLIVGGDFRQENGFIETKLLMNRSDRPTAIFASSDLITLGALQTIADEGLSIPEDVSLLTFDDFDFAPFLKCPLTAVRQPKEMMGEMAVKLLVEDLRSGCQSAKRIVLKPSLIRRDSVAPPLV
jgi:LacI family transcriptional regulator